MKIALVQSKMTANMADNLQKTISAMEKAAEIGSNIICFPEIQFSPFSLKVLVRMFLNTQLISIMKS